MIKVKDLTFKYPDQTPALKNISFSVKKNETLGIIGPNGAGKSTLLLHLNGILRGEGQVLIKSSPISKKNLPTIRAQVGYVFQDPNDQLFMPTVFDDIAFGLLNQGLEACEVTKQVLHILDQLGLAESKDKPAFLLSLGERKRVSLATILVLNPEIIIFDEPTVSLDPGTRRSFIELIKKISATKIIASHDLEMIQECCSHVILLAEGQIVSNGIAADILTNEPLLLRHNLEMPANLKKNFQ